MSNLLILYSLKYFIIRFHPSFNLVRCLKKLKKIIDNFPFLEVLSVTENDSKQVKYSSMKANDVHCSERVVEILDCLPENSFAVMLKASRKITF